jgi:hypothetical protein
MVSWIIFYYGAVSSYHLICFLLDKREWSKSDEIQKSTNKATNTMLNEYEFHNEVIIIII